MKELSESISFARELMVAKRNDMLQGGRYNLTIQEQRTVLYAVAQIKPEDTYLTEYTFDIKDFYALCGIEDRSYTRLKQILSGLKSKVWWVTLDNGDDSAVSWFGKLRTNNGKGTVTLKFDEDMMPFLLELNKQMREGGQYYTSYQLKYILPMKSKFGPRLYEILKSYQANNHQWFFRIEDLQKLLSDSDEKGNPQTPKTWANFAEFKRKVIDPAVKEINEYTDICVSYKPIREGRKYEKITFFMDNKTERELSATNIHIGKTLDGETVIDDDFMKQLADRYENDEEWKFKRERREAHEAEKAEKEQKQEILNGIKAWLDPEA